MTWLTTLKMLLHPGVVTVILIRFQIFFDTHYLYPFGWLLQLINLICCTVQVDSGAEISGGFVIIHANSIFISRDVEIGPRCILFHQNSIGFSPFVEIGTPHTPAHLVVGENVIFGAGACAFGNITIGSRSKIGVNAAVETSCPPDSTLFGVPARVVSKS